MERSIGTKLNYMKSKPEHDIKYINYIYEKISYNKVDGTLIWKNSAHKRVTGKICGNIYLGYIRVSILNKLIRAHRIVWLFENGTFPTKHLDHINGNTTDNRISNLREVSQRQNNANRIRHRNGYLVGTAFAKRENKWRADISINQTQHSLGYFNTMEEAHEAYKKALAEIE